MNDGHYKMIATARSQDESRNGAVKQAGLQCSKQHQRLSVISINTTYQGTGKELAQISDIARQVAWQASNTNVPSTRQNDDYKTTLIFNCVA